MIRVGFVLSSNSGWTGGLNYIRNLLATVLALPDRMIEPVLIISDKDGQDSLAGFEGMEVLHTPLVGSAKPVRAARRLIERVTGRDLLMENFLRRHRIRVLSHSGHLGPRSGLPAVAWLPDFQHVRMPEFFGAKEIATRDGGFRRTAAAARTIIVSSADARADLGRFAPYALSRTRILHFVAGMMEGGDARGRDYLRDSYGIDGPYFYLPNQFWQHKNHRLVVDALARLAADSRAPLVVSTGNTRDGRAPRHFEDLMHHAAATGARPSFKVLGLVPYADLAVLMRHAVAVINPSRFEGWSTTVEEAKSLGKAIILSDIPVHREQAPARARFVSPDDADEMAAAMTAMLADWSEEDDAAAMAAAAAALPERKAAFGRVYQAIILEAAGGDEPGR